MTGLHRAIKQRVKGLIELTPKGRDIYLSLAGSRLGICYRGVFADHAAAQHAAAKSQRNDYDVVNEKKTANAAEERERLGTWFPDADYPLLFWTSQLLHSQQRVLELGGSIGHFYYAAKRHLAFPENLRWQIAELPAAVALGEKIAAERGAVSLMFIDSAEIVRAQAAEVFVSAGTLQYMEQPLWDILSSLVQLPRHVLIHHLPVHGSQSIWTLQNLKVCEVPYRIYSKCELEEHMQTLGYELQTSWSYPRTIEIPFHREYVIEGYLGFYFRRA